MRKPLLHAPPAPPGSLAEALAPVPDPRHPDGWHPDRPPIPLVALLPLVVAATLGGARSWYASAQWGRERVRDDPTVLLAWGLPPGRSPSVATLHRVFRAVDVAAFEAAVGTWRARTGVAPTDVLAVAGQSLRGSHGDEVPGVHLVAVSAHQAAAVLAQLRTLRADLAAAFPPVADDRADGLGLPTPTAPRWVQQALAARGGRMAAVTVREPQVRHGRREERMLWALVDPARNAEAGSSGEQGVAWPHLAPVCRGERRRTPVRRKCWRPVATWR